MHLKQSSQSTIYIHNKSGIKRNVLTTQQIILNALILVPTISYTIPTQTNDKEINKHDTIIENKITTTATVIYKQTIGTITPLLVLHILLALIVVVNIINISKEPKRHIN